jgi:hypothetical protein
VQLGIYLNAIAPDSMPKDVNSVLCCKRDYQISRSFYGVEDHSILGCDAVKSGRQLSISVEPMVSIFFPEDGNGRYFRYCYYLLTKLHNVGRAIA